MADSINVFVDAAIPLDQMAEEVGELNGLTFEHQKDQYEEWYAARTDDGLFTIGTHDFEGDSNMNLGDYKYEITFWENRDKPLEEREKLQRETGKRIFEQLKSTGKYPLMYVFDVQKKLDEYRP